MSYQGGEGQSIETVENQPEEQEDYENALERKPKYKPNTSKVQTGLQNQPKSRTIQTGPQSQPKSGKVQADLKNQSKTSKIQTGLIKSDIGKSHSGSEELEDYENAPAKLTAQSEPSDKKRVDGELEDYENMAEQKLRKTGEKVDDKVKGKTGLKMEDNMQGKALKVAKADDENDLEDYENAKVVKPSGKTKQLMEKFERQKKNEKVVRNIESDDLEDYENTKKLSKKGKIGETQEKFENKQKQSKVNEMVKKTENAEALDSLEDYENMGPLSKKENPEDNSEKPYENMEIVRKTLKKRKA